MLLTFEPFDDVSGDVDDDDDDDVDEDEESGGEVVVGIRVVADGDRVRAIFAGGGAATFDPKIEAEKSSLGPKFGFKILSMEKGRAPLAANWLLLLLIGDVIGLGRSGWVSIGYAANGKKGWKSIGVMPVIPGVMVKPVGGEVGGDDEIEDLGEHGGDCDDR